MPAKYMKCPYCNQEHPDNTKFCPETGKKLEQLKACINPECSDFGKHILPLDCRYCPTCGYQLGNSTCDKNSSGSKKSGDVQVDINGVEYIDMGGTVLWATCNLGAKSPESLGDYYCWGEIDLKDECTEENYIHNKIKTSFFGLTTEYIYQSIGSNIAGTKYDVVTHLLGNPYMMPSKKHFLELKELCEWEPSSINGMRGWLVKSKKNGNKLFFPASGYKYEKDIRGYGREGYYPSADVSTNGLGWHWEFMFDICSKYNPMIFYISEILVVCGLGDVIYDL